MAGTLFGVAQATCTQRVFAVANTLSTPLTLHTLNMREGEHKKEPHISRQPFGKIPAFESQDGSVKLFESRAIARYLDHINGGTLTGQENPARFGLIETWVSVELSYFDPSASAIFGAIVGAKFRGIEPNTAEAEKHKQVLNTNLAVYEKHLANNKWLAGDEVSVADLFHLPVGTHVLTRIYPDLLDDKPNVKAWWERLSALPGWQKTLTMT